MNTTIAHTIIDQLGGNQFAVMTGARNFIAIENGVKFHIGKNCTKSNLVIITLSSSDLYTMEFWKRGTAPTFKQIDKYGISKALERCEPKMLHKIENVDAESLQRTFTDYTGMYTRL